MDKGSRENIAGEKKLQLSTRVWTPSTLEEAWERKQQFGSNSCFVSGGTLLQVQQEQGGEYPPHLISLERVQELKGIYKKLDGSRPVLSIGALTTIAVCRNDPFIMEKWMVLAEAARTIAASAVRNRATIGGNVSNGFGDMIPVLLAVDADGCWFDGKNFKIEKISKWLKRNTAKTEELLLTELLLPDPPIMNQSISFYKKVGCREVFTSSLVTISGYCGKNKAGEVEIVRLAVGGDETVPQRLTSCEKLLKGRMLTEEHLKKVYLKIVEEVQLTENIFASEDYRKWTAANAIFSELTKLIE
ncbi:FAD binding domain-containing protein [Bacillus taeanensis]|uniref:Xanthine dehydrogenase n=1 Tax=Bacillus taeanensis TaxID=273032 RepID=A0A366Y056_9BACI|nr:FAD binding domain-containing protein [Bacillus taeanensis]RBW69784.1 xanthine dehydrogenase [Bacillus taeanensis]